MSLVVNEVLREARPWPTPVAVSDFGSREDLIAANMASVHVPYFLDGRLTRAYRGAPCVDGSLSLGAPVRLPLPEAYDLVPAVSISSRDDAQMRAEYAKPADFLRLVEPDAIRAMMRRGEAYIDEAAVPGGALEALLGPLEPRSETA